MRKAAALTFCVLLLVYLRWLTPSMAPYAGSADSAGYLWSARLFRTGHLSAPLIVPPDFPIEIVGASALAPLGADASPHTALVPTYPTGFPLHLALAQLLAGDEERGTRAALLAIAAAALWLCYRVAREAALGRVAALVACATLAMSPLFLFVAVQPFSDVLALAWAEATVFFGWRGRRSRGHAVLAGASLGIATLVRPTNVVLAAPLLVARPHLRDVAVGAFAPVIFVLAYQTWVYGAPWRTGYGDVSTAFSGSFVMPSVRHYIAWLPWLASPIVVLAPGMWWAWRGADRWRAWVVAAWIGGVCGLYACYFHTSETWWYLRFVLPALPAAVIAGLAVVQRLWTAVDCGADIVRLQSSSALRRVALRLSLMALCVASLILLRHQPVSDTFQTVRPQERIPRETVAWMRVSGVAEHAPVLAVQLSGGLNYYAASTLVLRYDRLTATSWQAVRVWQRKAGEPVYAALFPFERDEFFDGGARLACDWEPRGAFRGVTLWRCPPPAAGAPSR